MQNSSRAGEIAALIAELSILRTEMVSATQPADRAVSGVHPGFRDSARNLLHYLALRRHDLRPLQRRLAALGLSSLGRAEAHVLATVDAVLQVLHCLDGRPLPEQPAPPVDFSTGQALLAAHTDELLGPAPARGVRIMVTLPTEAAHEYELVRDLLRQGMDCARINCAHDDAAAWQGMIDNLARARQELGKDCRVVMDLGGPKLRTGPLAPGPQVVRIRPERDELGRVLRPARFWLTASTPIVAPDLTETMIPVDRAWLDRLRPGDHVALVDARHSKRQLLVVEVSARGCLAETRKTTYLVTGTMLTHHPGEANRSRHAGDTTTVGELPSRPGSIALRAGDLLVLTRDGIPGRDAIRDRNGAILTPARIGCSIPGVLDDVRSGERVWFDDGSIGGIVEGVQANGVLVRIDQAGVDGRKLRSDKGINLPDSKLRLSALAEKDIVDLQFIAHHADVVELSFANSVADVEALQRELERHGNRQPGIVLKIETRRGFRNLPAMLLAAMRSPRCGVMIARGDLAVECGFERLAEVQEETLWICEAAHVPVIWATQVLENLAREGIPSRAEITDAAMAHRAECVMLNKGPHVLQAVQVLDDILRRMQAHQDKKQTMLRELHLAHNL